MSFDWKNFKLIKPRVCTESLLVLKRYRGSSVLVCSICCWFVWKHLSSWNTSVHFASIVYCWGYELFSCELWGFVWILMSYGTLGMSMTGPPGAWLPHDPSCLWCNEMSSHTACIATPALGSHLSSSASRRQEEHQHLKIILINILQFVYPCIIILCINSLSF